MNMHYILLVREHCIYVSIHSQGQKLLPMV